MGKKSRKQVAQKKPEAKQTRSARVGVAGCEWQGSLIVYEMKMIPGSAFGGNNEAMGT
jgi:hypothetical protein